MLPNNVLSSMTKGLFSSGGEDPKEVTADTMRRWNKLNAYAKEKGYAGNPELDHNPALRQKIFDEYNRLNPNDAIPISMVKPIQKELLNYKAQALENIKKYPQYYKGDPTKFMEHLSPDDDKYGQWSSQEFFPSAYIDKKRVGFAPKVTLQGVQQLIK